MKTSQGILFVIDDDRKSRMAVAALALSMRIKCETFVSAEAFLDRYDSALTGCALVDFRLGGMDGLELQNRLRAMGSALAVVLVSAYADVHLSAQAIESGAVAFIEKPYRSDDLADAVRMALDRSARTQRRAAEQAPPARPLGGREAAGRGPVPKTSRQAPNEAK
jgi:two-component system response regulator DctR